MAPTGVALRDPRELLLQAGESVIRRGGGAALTSRAVTEEAGVAKGVLHRHFDDFDAFVAELALRRIDRIEELGRELRAQAGRGSVADTVTAWLVAVFDPVTVAVVGMIVLRDRVRERLRGRTPMGLSVLAEAVPPLAAYLEAEQLGGRVDVAADVDALALTLVGTGHMLLAGHLGGEPDASAVHAVAAHVLEG